MAAEKTKSIPAKKQKQKNRDKVVQKQNENTAIPSDAEQNLTQE